MPVRTAMRWLTVCLLAVFCLPGPLLAAPKRIALLIGNQNYDSVGVLVNPSNDVKLMKSALEQAGFESVTEVLDANVGEMRKALRSFEDAASGADVAVVYYSGHGMEMNGMNYLIPVDAVLASDKDVEDETISLDRVQRSIEGAAKLKLIILDACRNNPFLETMKRSISKRSLQKGLAKVEPESSNMLVAFASKAGTQALDGSGDNSPFAMALAKFLIEPGLDIRIALGKVRDEVLKLTNAEQEPFVYGSLGGSEIILNINVNVNVANKTDGKAAPDNTLSEAAADWQNIRDLADQELLTAFLQKHGDDPVYRMLAEKKMRQLELASKNPNVGNDQIAWETMKGSTDPVTLQRFIDRYPDSPLRQEAEQQLAALQPKQTSEPADAGLSTEARDCYALASEKQSVPGFAGIDFNKIDAEKAIAACTTALSQSPDDAMLMEVLARAYDANQNYKEAYKYYEASSAKGNLYALTNIGWFSVLGNLGETNIPEGKAIMEKAANAGNPYAQVSLGLLYRGDYDGIPVDDSQAFNWYLKAAEQGYAEGLNYVGWAYSEGKGVEQDYAKSLTYYRKAADMGDPDSLSSVAYAYENGNGVAADQQMAVNLYAKAANAGDAYAMGALGGYYEEGKSVPQDYDQALSWYEKAADAGSSFAMGNLARFYDQGLSVKKDPAEAARWLIASIESGEQARLDDLKASPDGYSVAMRKQIQSVLKDRGFYKGSISGKMDTATKASLDALYAARDSATTTTDVQKSIDQAPPQNSGETAVQVEDAVAPEIAQCRELAADPYIGPTYGGYDIAEIDAKAALKACMKAVASKPEDLALLNLLGRAQEASGKFKEARASYWKAADAGDPDARTNLALFDILGTGGKTDVSAGMASLMRSVNAKNPNAQYRLAQLYAEGHGVAVDKVKAFNYLRLASDNGNIWAMGDLAEAYDQGEGTSRIPELAAKWALEAVRKGNNEILDGLKSSSDDLQPETRTAIQKLLTDMGMFKGKVDGNFGPVTTSALDRLAENG